MASLECSQQTSTTATVAVSSGRRNRHDSKNQEDQSRKKILFKFILDGQSWVTDPDQEAGRDYTGHLNNVLFIINPLPTATSTTIDTKDDALTPPAEETVAETVYAPALAVVKPVMQVAQITVELSPAPEQTEQPMEEVEDEDDKIIKALGGGIWGTPSVKVNDPTALSEHFQEALAANAAATSISASSPSPAVETEEGYC
ncbi:hypothetical protein KI688_012020 [Linnemannia hyalina]|uniref:Uncharacterized protein n=1 Tax=Linnemannia hyalina TaxID=64524 RepID=A0A9P8BTI2_9FUNG|nr:hypothetical protein KI688_012020 [Linnemannia hyalina]